MDASRVNLIDPFDKSVSTSGEGLDVARCPRRIAQRFANAGNGVVKAVVEIDKSVRGPDFRPKFFAGHQIASSLQQHSQYL